MLKNVCKISSAAVSTHLSRCPAPAASLSWHLSSASASLWPSWCTSAASWCTSAVLCTSCSWRPATWAGSCCDYCTLHLGACHLVVPSIPLLHLYLHLPTQIVTNHNDHHVNTAPAAPGHCVRPPPAGLPPGPHTPHWGPAQCLVARCPLLLVPAAAQGGGGPGIQER